MEIKVPKKPRVVIKEQQPDQRTVSVVPIRAISDRTLTAPQYRVLLAFCSYANKGGLTWVGIKTVGQKIGISTNRVAVLTRQLIAKGYIKVLKKLLRNNNLETIRNQSQSEAGVDHGN